MVSESPAIVIADDDWATRMVVALNLEPDGYEVRSASSARELAETLADGRAALVLLDIRMGGDNGIELARWLAEERPEVAAVFLTGASYLLTAAENDLAHELIEKPFTIERLRATVARLCPLEQQAGRRAGSDESIEKVPLRLWRQARGGTGGGQVRNRSEPTAGLTARWSRRLGCRAEDRSRRSSRAARQRAVRRSGQAAGCLRKGPLGPPLRSPLRRTFLSPSRLATTNRDGSRLPRRVRGSNRPRRRRLDVRGAFDGTRAR